MHVFFTDRDLGKRFPEILRAAGLGVERHADHFEPDCPDEDWLAAVAKRGWIADSHNLRIRYTPNELDAVVRHRVPLLIAIGKAPLPVLAHSFAATRHRIQAFVDAHSPPWIAKVYRPSPRDLADNPHAPGTVSLWYPSDR
jgi:hypothetical protein